MLLLIARVCANCNYPDTSMSAWRERFDAGATGRRRVLATKTGAAVVLTALLALVDDMYTFTQSGPWAVVTVVITMQPTVGATVYKAVQRCLGTVFAAIAAALVGSFASQLLPGPQAQVMLGVVLMVATAALNYLSTAKEWTKWSYAIFLSYLTFDFLVLQAYRESFATSLNRILMIAVGAAAAALISCLPPRVVAFDQVRGMCADSLCDSADALLAATQAYTEGRRLRRLESIDFDAERDDEVCTAFSSLAFSSLAVSRLLFSRCLSGAQQVRRRDHVAPRV